MNGDGNGFGVLGGGDRLLVRLHSAGDEPGVAILIRFVLGIVCGFIGSRPSVRLQILRRGVTEGAQPEGAYPEGPQPG